ncbi:MAG: hypothetical protein EZS28_008343 [Streblomastix strix]|uniref:Uncharacterized protein n=1 Tax=Streblomastix strix TaxID=222440 RepID=A0A5J4WND7_9EUKA|nr:MAG: hypothetical protein EZS28_008343 [Streblomastix strix]
MSTVTGLSFIKSDADNTVVLFGDGGTKPIHEFGGKTNEHVLQANRTTKPLSEFVNIANNQSINVTKTFNSNDNAIGFIKTCNDDISVLFAGGGDRLLTSFGGIEELTSTALSFDNGGAYNAGTSNTDYLVQDDVAVATYTISESFY